MSSVVELDPMIFSLRLFHTEKKSAQGRSSSVVIFHRGVEPETRREDLFVEGEREGEGEVAFGFNFKRNIALARTLEVMSS